jgi:aldehyde dehydrogenase (NAD+)
MTTQLITPTIPDRVQQQRDFFNTGQTKAVEFRLEQLKRLKQAIIDRQDAILQAAQADLGRPAFEAYFEIATLAEINLALKHLKTWVKPRRVATSIDQFPASAWVQPEPLGVVLIIGPWNYPFQLIMSPLIGAIAAGNCAMLKPSEHAPHMAKVIAELIQATFDPGYITVIEGDTSVSQQLLAEKFDHIFFTGGTSIGKIVMAAAAKHLTPVTLELGGKSPCIVDADARLDYTAKRIVWGKLINTGQTCIAPDYLLVDRRIKSALIEQMKHWIEVFYGSDPATSPDYGRIINSHHFNRLTNLLNGKTPIVGGKFDPDTRYIAPTIVDDITWEDAIMQEEIFGPILPILTYDNINTAIAEINSRAKPLALYLFSNNEQTQNYVLQSTSSGGVCLNDTVMQFGVLGLPFGGVGESGLGNYHGKASFDTFSHQKSVLKRSLWLDLGWRYAPYKPERLKQIKRIVTG